MTVSFVGFSPLGVVLSVLCLLEISCGFEADYELIHNDIIQYCPPSINEYMQRSYMVPYGVKNRALLTLPPDFYVAPSVIPDAGLGVFSKVFVPAYTWLSEYEGIYTPAKMEHEDYSYLWLVYGGDNGGDELLNNDAIDPQTSNWARYVNMARNVTELNVWPVFCYNKVYYMTSRNVYPSQELMTYYGSEYADELNIDHTNFPKFP